MVASRLIDEGILRPKVPLGPMTTYRLGGPAAWFAEPASEQELRDVLAVAADLGLEVVPIGRGSNVVVSDTGVDGLVIRLSGAFLDVSVDAAGMVTAGGGAQLSKVARSSVDAGRGGLEFLVGIPGSVGGAVRMNAGCLGSETADWLRDVRIADATTSVARTVTAADLDMSYRHSAITGRDIVVSARFSTEPQPAEVGRGRIREVTQWRRRNQPGGTLNAGSVFKNPPGDAAGRLIDELGLKGLSVGAVRVSPRHANFFEADAAATAADVHALVVEVVRRVRDATGIELQPEIKFLGAFDETGEPT